MYDVVTRRRCSFVLLFSFFFLAVGHRCSSSYSVTQPGEIREHSYVIEPRQKHELIYNASISTRRNDILVLLLHADARRRPRIFVQFQSAKMHLHECVENIEKFMKHSLDGTFRDVERTKRIIIVCTLHC